MPWMEMWVSLVLGFGFVVADRARTLFSYQKDGYHMIMATIVDDSVVAYNDVTIFDKFTAYLRTKIPIAVQELAHICGLRVSRDLASGTLTVDQQEYIKAFA